MKLIHISKPFEPDAKAKVEANAEAKALANAKAEANANVEAIHVFTQYFIHRDASRVAELRSCLQRNVANPDITHIHLLNERIYTPAELGVTDLRKITQSITPGKKRLTFQHVFQYIRERSLIGFLVLTNADIFFDSTLKRIRIGQLHTTRQMMALLRYEYNGVDTATSPIYGPRNDSQDTWIFHSNFVVQGPATEKAFAFEFGTPGCDNKMIYLARILGYDVINDPRAVRIYHYHRNPARDYHGKAVLPPPWGVSVPYGYNLMSMTPSLGVHMLQVYQATDGFQHTMFEDNRALYTYLLAATGSGRAVVIPRIAGIENNVAVFGRLWRTQGPNTDIQAYFQKSMPVMKHNAGVVLPNIDAIFQYSDAYLKVFDNCDMYCGWDVQGNVRPHIEQSHQYIQQTYHVEQHKKVIWSLALDVFHYLHDTPWTWALRGKRILIVSSMIESIREKIAIRDQLWGDTGIDLFPDCTFVFLKPPMTQGDEPARDFMTELREFTVQLDSMRDQFDVALVSCGGYGNPVCNYIYETCGKSAIYVGGVLQMYFGVVGGRWLTERPEILRLYMNEHWTRPKVNERPKGSEKIEKGCYW
jgi:hypothetical protein